MTRSWGVAILFWSATAAAGELREFYSGSRTLAMGNAYVGLADDEQSVFLNPAGLALIREYSFHYFMSDLGVGQEVIANAKSGQQLFQDASLDTVDQVLGKNTYAQAQLASIFLMPNLGVGIIVDQQVAAHSENKPLPQFTLGYQTTNGIQVAYGTNLLRGQRQRASMNVGIAAKLLWRRGGYRDLALLDVINISQDKLGQIVGNFGRGIGVDAGLLYVFRVSNDLQVSAGVAFTDIGDTNFGDGPDPIDGNLSFGLAAKYQFRKITATVAYDYKHLLEQTDWRKKNHFGIEIALQVISLLAGVNQVSLTYGFALDLWLLKVTAASYGEELGSFVNQDTERRYVVRADMKFDLGGGFFGLGKK